MSKYVQAKYAYGRPKYAYGPSTQANQRLWKKWMLPVLAVCLIVVWGISGASTVALWSDAEPTKTLMMDQATVGLAVSKGATIQYATGMDSTAELTIGSTDAQALVSTAIDSQGQLRLAVPFDVTMLVSANYGMDYYIPSPDVSSSAIFAQADMTFFRVSNSMHCTVAAADTAVAYIPGSQVTGIPAGTLTQQTQTDYWCLVLALEPEVYQNTASAQGTNLIGEVENSASKPTSTWRTYLLSDPAQEPDLSITVVPVLEEGCES